MIGPSGAAPAARWLASAATPVSVRMISEVAAARRNVTPNHGVSRGDQEPTGYSEDPVRASTPTISANAWKAVGHHPPATASAARYVLAERALDVAQFELTANASPAYAYAGFHTLARLRRHVRIADAARATAAAPVLRHVVLAASRCERRIGCRRWLAGRRWGSGRPARGWRASRCSAWGRGSRGQARRARRRWGR